MARNSASAGRTRGVSAPDPEQPVGKNLYIDNKRRMIYTSPLLREALYLPKYDYRKFNRYKSRYLVAIATFMILSTAMTSWFDLPLWVSVVISLLVFAAMEFSFYKFQKTLTVVKNFDISKAQSTVSLEIAPDMRTKCWLKIVLYAILGVLLVVNAYEQKYDLTLLLCCWGALVYCFYTAFKLLMMVLRSPKKA